MGWQRGVEKYFGVRLDYVFIISLSLLFQIMLVTYIFSLRDE